MPVALTLSHIARGGQICNAGFVVPPTQRGAGFGSQLAKSYVHYAPKLGYHASVFNLVYVNNVASVKYALFSSCFRYFFSSVF